MMTDDQKQILMEFQDWREAHGLGFNKGFVPVHFDNIKDLEDEYWKAECKAKDAAKETARSAVSKPRDDGFWFQLGDFHSRQTAGKEIAELRARVAELEANQVTFGGTWKPGTAYAEKCLVSFRGGLWLSKMPNNTTRPGEGPAWRLCVKSGDAAK
jgi:hypothetical protein